MAINYGKTANSLKFRFIEHELRSLLTPDRIFTYFVPGAGDKKNTVR
jgi:hypothetical protein